MKLHIPSHPGHKTRIVAATILADTQTHRYTDTQNDYFTLTHTLKLNDKVG